MWAAVAAYVIWAGASARRVRMAKRVGGLEIEVVDSSSQGHLVSAAMVRGWISQSGIETIGTAVDAVDLTGIERLIARNGFVDEVAAYVSYDGVLHVAISQRKPLLRLLTDGLNAYVTPEGYVFAAPRASSLYVPVVTGSYRPPFPASYAGSVREHVDRRSQEIENRIAELEREKYPLYRRELENDRNVSALRRMRIKRQWWRLEGSREFDERVDALHEKKAALLYDCLDHSDFYTTTIEPGSRSKMNVRFNTPNADLDAKFVKESVAAGMSNLKAHRSTGGLRASIYNCMPMEGVEYLVKFMKKFEAENK